MTMPKICLACKHFNLDTGERGYSSYTPGGPGSVTCYKDHWELEGEAGDQSIAFFEFNLTAQTCPDFEPSEIAKKYGW